MLGGDLADHPADALDTGTGTVRLGAFAHVPVEEGEYRNMIHGPTSSPGRLCGNGDYGRPASARTAAR